MPIVKSKKDAASSEHNPSAFFKSHEKVAKALLQSLEENDTDAFLEILDVYLKINRTKVAKETQLSRTTTKRSI